MPIKKSIRYLGASAAILVALALVYLAVRPWWRLPFDRVAPLSAVAASQGMALHLTAIDGSDTVALHPRHIWYGDARRVWAMLQQNNIGEQVQWASWWLIPDTDESAVTANWLFIGDAKKGLGNNWSPKQYGPTLPFQDGAIFTYNVGTADALYFARHHNLLIIGMLPYQVEKALHVLKSGDNWQEEPYCKAIAGQVESLDTGHSRLWLQSEGLSGSVPAYWLEETNPFILRKQFSWLCLDMAPTADSLAAFEAWYAPPTDSITLAKTPSLTWLPPATGWAQAAPLHSNAGDLWPTYIQPWWDGRAWSFHPDTDDGANSQLWILGIRDTASQRAIFRQLEQKQGLSQQRNYLQFTLKQVASPGLLAPLSDRRGMLPWMLELEDRVVFAINREDLERYVDYHLVGASLLDGFSPWEGTEVGFAQWSNTDEQRTQLLQLLFPAHHWAGSGWANWSLGGFSGGVLHLRGNFHNLPIKKSPSALAWEWEMPQKASAPPRLLPVIDAFDGVCRSMMVQQENGTTWLIDAAGQVLWERQLPPGLFAPVYQVPEHGKIAASLVASHPGGLLALEMDGTNANRFGSNNGKAVTTAPLPILRAVWRVYAGAAQGGILNVDAAGASTPQWQATAGKDSLRCVGNLHYMAWQGADLLIAKGQNGTVKAWDTNGKLLWQHPTAEDHWQGSGLQLQQLDHVPPLSPARNRLVEPTKTGKVRVLAPNGEAFYLALGQGRMRGFVFQNGLHDERADYWVLRNTTVQLYAYHGEDFAPQWTKTLPESADTLIGVPPLGVLAVHDAKKQCWLIDGQGNIQTKDPLAGSQQVITCINAEGNPLLITVFENRLYAYLFTNNVQ